MPRSKIDKLYDKPRNSAKPNSEEITELLAKARQRARDGASYWGDNWEAMEDDLRFLGGEQWPSGVRTERELEQRPCLVNNVLPSFVDQILGDQRQNRVSIKVSATDFQGGEDGNDEEPTISNLTGTTQYTLSQAMTGAIMGIEYACDAQTSYDIASQSALESGMGYLRVLTDFLADDSFDQEFVIKHIENQFSVTLDPNAKERDRSDGMWALVDEYMPKEEFKAKYPNATPQPITDKADEDMGGWFGEHTVRVSEYFTREPVNKEVALLSDGRVVDIKELEPVVDELLEQGIRIVRTRKLKTYKTWWRKITGLDVLEGPVEVPCSTIPISPLWGKAHVLKNRITFRSLFRHSKDAQRMQNYWDSAGTESVALAPKAPFVGAEGHVEGREQEWETANTTNRSLLTYIAQYQGDPGPKRSQPAATPAAEITMGMQATDKIKATMGMYDASIGAAGNETSGRAIIARQRQGDRGSFEFTDNRSKSIQRIGKLIVEMFPRVVDTERIIRLKFPDGKEDFVRLNQQVYDEDTKEWVTIHNLAVAKYDVVVTTGPAYATQRQEAAETMLEFARVVPNAAGAMADLIAYNMDWPGADSIAERLKKIVPPQVLTQDEREKLQEDMPEQQEPTPEQQVEMAEYEARTAEAQADMQKAKATEATAAATEAKAQADMVEAQLQTAEAQAKLQLIENEANGGNQAYQQVREIVAEALAEIMAAEQAPGQGPGV